MMPRDLTRMVPVGFSLLELSPPQVRKMTGKTTLAMTGKVMMHAFITLTAKKKFR